MMSFLINYLTTGHGYLFLQPLVKVLPPRSVGPSLSIYSFTGRSDVERGLDEQNNSITSGSSAYSDTPLLAGDGDVDLEENKCVYAKLGGLSAGVRPPPAVDPTTVQCAGINIRATHVSRIT